MSGRPPPTIDHRRHLTVRALLAYVAGFGVFLAMLPALSRFVRGFLWDDIVPWLWILYLPAVGFLYCAPKVQRRWLWLALAVDLLLLMVWSMARAPDLGVGLNAQYGDVPYE